MALFDSVPRQLYTDLQQRYDALLEKYHLLKMAGASLPPEPKPGRVVPAGPGPEEQAHRRMVEDIAKEVEAMAGVPPAVAKAEAKRIRDAVFGPDGVP